MSAKTAPYQVDFDPPPEIFATDSSGGFWFPLQAKDQVRIETEAFDEVRLMVSIWHPSRQRSIDIDRAYVEVRGSFGSLEEHWIKVAEIEPVVPPYDPGETFDGWIVLPVFGRVSAFGIAGRGFHPRARLQIRSSAYFVA